MRKTCNIIIIILLTLTAYSCENVFHNDELDFMWRLDSVEFIDGVDFDGNPCTVATKEGLWLSFARDLVKVDDRNSYTSAIGILTDNGKQVSFDFSMYEEPEWPGTDTLLKSMGINTRLSTFSITLLDKKKLILTGDKTILRLTKW